MYVVVSRACVAKEPCPSPHGRCSPSASDLCPQPLAVISPVPAQRCAVTPPSTHTHVRQYLHGLPTRTCPLASPSLCALSGATSWLPRCFGHSTAFRHRRSFCLRHTPHASHPCPRPRPLIGSCACKRLNHLLSPLLRLRLPPALARPPRGKKNFPHPRLPPPPPHFWLQGPILIKQVQGETPPKPCSAHHPLALSFFLASPPDACQDGSQLGIAYSEGHHPTRRNPPNSAGR